MSNIRLDTTDFRKNAKDLSNLANRLDKVQRRLNRTFSAFTLSSKGIGNGQRIGTAADRLRKCENYLKGVAEDFDNVEKLLTECNPLDFVIDEVSKNSIVLKATRGGVTTSAWASFGDVSTSSKAKLAYRNKLEKEYWDEKAKSQSQLRIKKEWSAEASLFKAGASADCGWASGSAEVKVFTAEGKASIEGGFYTEEVDKNGKVKKVWSPQVKAEVGASVSVLAASAEGKLDGGIAGINAKGEVEALSAGAKGKIKISKDGFEAKASAEANLVKVGGTAGLTVLGSEVGSVGAHFKVGAGAHADVKISNGKIKCDIGAAVGIGFDVSFEIDVVGTVKAVSKAATSAWNVVSGGAKAVGNFFGSIFGKK